MDDKFPRFMNQSQASKMLGISINTFYKLVDEQHLPIIKLGTFKRVDQVQLLKWLDTHTVK
ncbi:MAG: helix-turn-helix domain-containing protein [Liquorilactobacillus nagelii]|jgi:excisionase family DNA binding protein|uniref:helix-turn-helix domain-containing protein n=1 Tax=Liquorilactobacillus nagelii TaxID=82688 RepID=UPI002430B5AB|nr:helix-turn-helix domain-containing protein [Liquorilactobacillus nagelii]MCI1921767.1 helix-turn-helix domain-containing protein [Liquorilactobacillus nagelii]MCI1976717.1 helix-turn-helix domain-containing protein [Liquorilactobacillus nagelii]